VSDVAARLNLALKAWEKISASPDLPHGAEPSIILVPDTSPEGYTLAAYLEIEDDDSLARMCGHLVAHLAADGATPQWAAHCGVVFHTSVTSLDDMPVEPLDELAKAGDDRVRELVYATVVSWDGQTAGQGFVPPLNEPFGDPAYDIQGTVVDTLGAMLEAVRL
jgi:hypothetical protein